MSCLGLLSFPDSVGSLMSRVLRYSCYSMKKLLLGYRNVGKPQCPIWGKRNCSNCSCSAGAFPTPLKSPFGFALGSLWGADPERRQSEPTANLRWSSNVFFNRPFRLMGRVGMCWSGVDAQMCKRLLVLPYVGTMGRSRFSNRQIILIIQK